MMKVIKFNYWYFMNYIKIYYYIINRAKSRGLDKKKLEGYFERHHIIPACYFKSRKIATYKENLVLLTGEEHVICHHLLWKNDYNNFKIALSYNIMINFKNENHDRISKLTAKQFNILKYEVSKHLVLIATGKKYKYKKHTINRMGSHNPMFGRHHSDKTKMLQSKPRKPYNLGSSNPKSLKCKIDNIEFESITAASKYFGKSRYILKRTKIIEGL